MPHIPLKSVVSVSLCSSDHFQLPLAGEEQSVLESVLSAFINGLIHGH